jgi:hypothetical protein
MTTPSSSPPGLLVSTPIFSLSNRREQIAATFSQGIAQAPLPAHSYVHGWPKVATDFAATCRTIVGRTRFSNHRHTPLASSANRL